MVRRHREKSLREVEDPLVIVPYVAKIAQPTQARRNKQIDLNDNKSSSGSSVNCF